MRARLLASTAVAILWMGGPGWAAATPEGAKTIAQGYATWLTQAVVDKGIVSVAPQGDDYVVSWDIQKLIDMANPGPDVVKIDKLTYTLTPKGEDAFVIKGDRFPPISFDVATDKGKMKGTVDVSGFRLDMTHDPKAAQMLTEAIVSSLMTAKIHFDDPSGTGGDITLTQNGLGVDVKATKATSGLDFSINQSIKSITETINAPAAGGDSPVKMSIATGPVTSEAVFSGLRASEMGDLWKLAVALGPQGKPPPDLKDKIASMLPLWNDFHAKAEVKDMAFDAEIPGAPMHVEIKSFGESIAMTGFTQHAAAEFGVKLGEASSKMAMLPPWASSVQPVSFDINVKVAVDGMDQVARLALADQQFIDKGELSDDARQKAQEILMKGHPHVVIAPGAFKTPTLDLTYEGDVAINGDTPSGRFTITAAGLDKTQELIQQISKGAPDAQQAMMGLALVKGLATTGADGRLVWKIELSADGAVTINGAPMPGSP